MPVMPSWPMAARDAESRGKRARLITVVACLLACCVGMAAADDIRDHPPRLSASEAAARLDVASFPNSLRPRQRPDLKTLAQNGFTVVIPVKGGVEVYEPDRSWLFGVRVLDSDADGGGVLCILDQARNGGTYVAQDAVEVRRGSDGLLHATGRSVERPDCTPFRTRDSSPER